MTKLILIRFLNGFERVIIYKQDGGYIFEADGEKYIGTHLCVEEAFEQAYFYLKAKQMAKELCKTAKVVL